MYIPFFSLISKRLYFLPQQISKEEFDYHFENILAARASQLPENVRNLTIDIRKSYEELIKSKKSESTPVPACRAIDSKSDKKIVKNKDEKLNDNYEEKENEYDDDDEFENENENEIESVHMDDDNNVQKREQEDDAVQTNIDSKTLPVERYNGDDIFLWNADNAVKRVLELKDEKDVQKQNDFSLWKNKKDTEMREKEEKDVST